VDSPPHCFAVALATKLPELFFRASISNRARARREPRGVSLINSDSAGAYMVGYKSPARLVPPGPPTNQTGQTIKRMRSARKQRSGKKRSQFSVFCSVGERSYSDDGPRDALGPRRPFADRARKKKQERRKDNVGRKPVENGAGGGRWENRGRMRREGALFVAVRGEVRKRRRTLPFPHSRFRQQGVKNGLRCSNSASRTRVVYHRRHVTDQ